MAAALAVPARAAEETGTIRVTLQNGETLVPDGAVSLYLVAEPMDGDYRLTDTFGGGVIRGGEALSPALARWLGEMTGTEGWEKELDGLGSAEYRDLDEGLYLLVQSRRSTGYFTMEPMLVQIPCQGQWHVQSYPMMQEITLPPTGDSPLPLLGAVGMLLSGTGLVICNRAMRRKQIFG